MSYFHGFTHVVPGMHGHVVGVVGLRHAPWMTRSAPVTAVWDDPGHS